MFKMCIKYSDPLIQIDRYIEIKAKVNENCAIFNSGGKNVWLTAYYSILHLLVTEVFRGHQGWARRWRARWGGKGGGCTLCHSIYNGSGHPTRY